MPGKATKDLDAIGANLQEQVGGNIRRLRAARGITQEHLAHVAGLATRHLQKIEAGQVNVTLRTLGRLGAALGVGVSTLVAGREDGEHR